MTAENLAAFRAISIAEKQHEKSIITCAIIFCAKRFSSAVHRLSGGVATVITCMKDWVLPQPVPPVSTRLIILNFWVKTINKEDLIHA